MHYFCNKHCSPEKKSFRYAVDRLGWRVVYHNDDCDCDWQSTYLYDFMSIELVPILKRIWWKRRKGGSIECYRIKNNASLPMPRPGFLSISNMADLIEKDSCDVPVSSLSCTIVSQVFFPEL